MPGGIRYTSPDIAFVQEELLATPTSGTSVSRTLLTGDPVIDSLLDGYHWSSAIISYSFIVPGVSFYATNYPDLSLWTQVGAFTGTQQSATVSALNEWAYVSNLQFTSSVDTSTTVGTLRLGFSYSATWGNFAGQTYTPDPISAGGDVWLNPAANDNIGLFLGSGFGEGTYAFYTLLHEIGHALGLKHPFQGSTDGGGQSIAGTSYSNLDSRVFTLMSYTTLADHADAIGFSFNPTTPMLLDISAIQAIYGANYSYNSGNTSYTFTDAKRYFETIWDGGGTNTIAYSGTKNAAIDLREGHGSAIGNPVYAYTLTNPTAYVVNNVWIAFGTKIQIADLSQSQGSYSVDANDFGDQIVCGIGIGVINGGKGGDTIYTGPGSETINCGVGIDTVVFSRSLSSYLINYVNGVYRFSSVDGFDAVTGAEVFKFAGVTMAAAQLQSTTNTISIAVPGGTVHTTIANDAISGLSGINRVTYSGKYSDYVITNNSNQIQVQDTASGRDGTDVLRNVERLQFSDRSVAFDVSTSFELHLGGNAGEVAKLLGAVFGPTSVQQHPNFMGIGLGLLDNGMSYADVMQLALNVRLGAPFTNEQEIQLIYGNLLGHAATVSDIAFWSGAINSGQYSQVMLAELAAETSTNMSNINLIGLAQSGIQYM